MIANAVTAHADATNVRPPQRLHRASLRRRTLPCVARRCITLQRHRSRIRARPPARHPHTSYYAFVHTTV